MPITNYRQNDLWSRKGEFYLLREQNGYSIRRLAEAFECSKGTVATFIHSDRYVKFRLYMGGDRIVDTLKNLYKDWPTMFEDLRAVSATPLNEIVAELEAKYPGFISGVDA